MKLKLWELILFVLIPISMICGDAHAQEGKIWYEDMTPQEYVNEHRLFLPEDLKQYLDNPTPNMRLIPGKIDKYSDLKTTVVTYFPKWIMELAPEVDAVSDIGARAVFCTREDCTMENCVYGSLCRFQIYSHQSGWITIWEYSPPVKDVKKKVSKRRV